jgi:YD repeat-containing protein
MTDAEGRDTVFTHGGSGNLNGITAPGGARTRFSYDELGRVQTVTQPTATAGEQAVTRMRYEAGRTLVADVAAVASGVVVLAGFAAASDSCVRVVAPFFDPSSAFPDIYDGGWCR